MAAQLAAPLRLEQRINGILLRLEKELDQAEEAIGEGGVGAGVLGLHVRRVQRMMTTL